MSSFNTSVITVTFNNYDELVATCRSIAPLKGSIEQIVINGGSCDQTKQFLASNPEIVSVSEKDKGIADAFNKGLIRSAGQYVMYVNSGDSLIYPQYILEAEKIFESNPEVHFVFGNLAFQHPQAGQLTYLFKPYKRLSAGQPYFFPTMIFRRSVFDKVGLFNLDFRIGMDFDLIVRMEKSGLKGHYLNTAPVVLMDGHGISSLQEYKSILENERSLKINEVYSRQDFVNIARRKFRFFLKKVLSAFHLEKIIYRYKQHKYSTKNS